jgi:8-amino-7-oxononanoate synthase
VSDDYLPGTFFGPSTLVELLRRRARCLPDQTAFTILVDGEDERFDLTYGQLDRQARAIAAWLESHDLVGQRALLLYPAGAEFIAAFFGCLYAGVVAVPVYPPRRNRSLSRIQAIADACEARVALTTDLVLQRVEPLIDETPHLKALTWLATCCVADDENLAQQWVQPEVHGDTLAFLQYTSGSTGMPKGVMLTHSNLVHNSALIAHAFEHTRSGSGVFWLPSYHDMGLIGGILQPMYVARPNVLMSPMSFLQKPYRWLAAISKYRGTTSGGPNFAYDLCVEKVTPEQRKTLDLSCWRVAFNGAEPVRAETLEAFCKAFEPCGFRREAFYPCFGLAEATLIVSGGYAMRPPVIRSFDLAALGAGRVIEAEPGDAGAHDLVGCGQNLPDQQIVIADPETMTTCPPGRVGEIWVCGPSMAQGYWNRPEATAATFRAYLQDTGAGPFMRTGDLGFMLDDELFVTGRIKDLIIVHGVNHYPQDIELTVQESHERLRRDTGAAFSVEVAGKQELVLVQEVERHRHADHAGIFEAMRKAVAGEHDLHPHAIVLLKAGSIPKTSSGKIQRHACREGYLAGTLEAVAQWQSSEGGAPAPQTSRPAPRPRAVAPAAPAASAAGAAVPEPQRAAATSGGNGHGNGAKKSVTEIVLEEIRRVARDRAAGLTMDTPIIETGLDSLERMEILAAIEERFGGRFPQEIYAELETTRHLVAAVEKYLGAEPRARQARPAEAVIPPETYCFDQFPEYLRLKQNLDLIDSLGLGNPYFVPHEGITNDRTRIGGRELISFATYNYLGMSGDPAVMQFTKEAIDRFGTSASASRLVSGEKTLHVELERGLAGWVGAEDAIVMVGGHATNETVIGHLFGPGDLILHDALSHNSIIQGCILSGARRRPFPHNDWQTAEQLLAQFRHEYRRVLVVIEGVYSMDGDIPDLPRFVELKKKHQALLMVDEAHSMGTLGAHGRGIGEHCGVPAADVDIWMGTLSKSFGSCGGYIAGTKVLVTYLKYTAPGFVFSAAIPPPAAAAALASLRVMEAQPQRVAQLQANARQFLELAKARGLNTGMSHDSPVVPIIIGNSLAALRLSRAMFARGVNVQPILHPAVEESAARLRYFITSLHTAEQIRCTVETMAEELEKIAPALLFAQQPA